MSSATALGSASGRSAVAPEVGVVHKANFECLDGLRFIAAFMVVCAHTLGFGWTMPLINIFIDPNPIKYH